MLPIFFSKPKSTTILINSLLDLPLRCTWISLNTLTGNDTEKLHFESEDNGLYIKNYFNQLVITADNKDFSTQYIEKSSDDFELLGQVIYIGRVQI